MRKFINFSRSDSKIISILFVLVYIILILPLKLVKKLIFPNWKLAFKVSAVFSFMGAVIMFGFLVFQMNQEASERYLISKYEKKLDQLTKENQTLGVKFSKANAISGASDLAEKLNFEKINQISYIKLTNNKVVKK